ncbi:hypothetical protein L218DRAFT_461728 [Marasmius fiardii PR-910]|nr:hypothetical protein L218DRAFT_461728 [Marasmius fiardii PR-910]
MITDADRLRIIVALAALKYKPAEQSCTSYVLDLQTKFPPEFVAGATGPGHPGCSLSREQVCSSYDDHTEAEEKVDHEQALRWKEHALRLEKEIGVLKADYEAERISGYSSESSRKCFKVAP